MEERNIQIPNECNSGGSVGAVVEESCVAGVLLRGTAQEVVLSMAFVVAKGGHLKRKSKEKEVCVYIYIYMYTYTHTYKKCVCVRV